mgnify:CR=1 FL=1
MMRVFMLSTMRVTVNMATWIQRETRGMSDLCGMGLTGTGGHYTPGPGILPRAEKEPQRP